MRRGRVAVGRVFKQGTASFSLFPFLAVLISTMGALILLLVVLARHARLQAAQTIASETSDRQAELQTQRELVQWRIDQLKESRAKTESQLADARLSLAQIEDHARQLKNQLVRLEATWADLASLDKGDAAEGEALLEALQRLKTQITQAQQQLDEARRAAADRRRSYAIVPYQGPRGTHRRPIYIECRAENIILRPEGIVFTPSDFAGPLGPGNPLEAALRAIREEWLSGGQFDPETEGEPYPLLLVRPSGIEAYYVARSAMQSWASDFGYELIGEDWKLEFPAPDPGLGEVLRQTVEAARVRRARLAAAVPRYYPNPQRRKYRASPYRGGLIIEGGRARGDEPRFPAERAASPPGTHSQPIDESGVERMPSGHRGRGPLPDGWIAGRPPGERLEPSPPGGSATSAQRPGEWMPRPEEPQRNRPAQGVSLGQLRPLAETRGHDWGLPNAAQGSVPITRPIRVDCYPQRLVVVPDERSAAAKEIPLGPRTEDAVDGFIAAVWELMDSWGIAGHRMYWRPFLNIHVAPGAEDRYAELKVLLDQSGLEVRRKGKS